MGLGKAMMRAAAAAAAACWTLLPLLAVVLPPGGQATSGSPVNLTALVQDILSLQDQQSRDFAQPDSWASIEGLFRTEVHTSFSGALAGLRGAGVPALVVRPSLLVLLCLLQASALGGLPPPPAPSLQAALQGVQAFHSQNFPPGSSVLSPNPEVYDKKLKVWRPAAQNPGHAPALTTPLLLLDAAVSNKSQPAVELRQRIASSRPLEAALNQSVAEWSGWRLPATADCLTNLALGAALKAGGDNLDEFFEAWQYVNSNLQPLLSRIEALAYRPFSSDKGRNSIDARSYYWLRPFLQQISSDDEDDVAIVTAWVSRTTRAGVLRYGSRALHPSSVDLSTSASFLHGMTAALLQQLLPPSPALLAVYRWTGRLLAWGLASPGGSLGGRPDLALASCPSRYLLYWTAARTLDLLVRAPNLTLPVLLETRSLLSDALQNSTTAAILDALQDGGLSDDGKGLVYVDDVIGVYDLDDEGKVKPSGADRLFSSALAASALLTVWTQDGENGELQYHQGTHSTVKLGVDRLVNFLHVSLQGPDLPLENAVRARLTRNNETLPCAFPATDVMAGDGEVANVTEWSPDLSFLVSGVFSPGDYDGLEVALCGHVGNQSEAMEASADSVFPYWSSPALTKAACLMTLAHYHRLSSKAKGVS